MKKFLYWLSGRLRLRFIKPDGNPYIERYFLFVLFGRTFYLHRYLAADSNEYPHDHPFDACSFVLTGGYIEEIARPCLDNGFVKKDRKVSFFNSIHGNTFHRIKKVKKETWTLFIHGERYKPWGFLKKTLHPIYELNDNNIENQNIDRRYAVPACLYFQPDWKERLPENRIVGWHNTALKGNESKREPLNV